MADNNGATEPAAGAEAPQPPKMQVLGQFIRDFSFENIMVQKGIAGGDVAPEVSVQVGLDAKKRSTDNQYEVITKYSISSKNKSGGETLFVLELEYGGIFLIENIPDEQLHPFLLIECPRMLFPFVRRVVADISREGGFPPLNLETVDFVALYRNMIAQRQQEASEAPVS